MDKNARRDALKVKLKDLKDKEREAHRARDEFVGQLCVLADECYALDSKGTAMAQLIGGYMGFTIDDVIREINASYERPTEQASDR